MFDRALIKAYALFVKMTYPFASVGKGLAMHRTCRLFRPHARQIKLGNGVSIMKDVWLNIAPTPDDEIKLIIDDRCLIGLRTTITAKNHVHLEHDVVIADSVVIADHTRAFDDIHVPIYSQGTTAGGRIRIEMGCWIGHCSAIICNRGDLVIGRNSVIGANSVVTHSIPPYSVAMGNPAKVVKHFDPVRGAWIVGSAGTVEAQIAAQ
jgi:acetyltransferase-like isoleucine patch superfamily enzyme